MKTQAEWDNFDKLRAGLLDAGVAGINLMSTFSTPQVCVVGRAIRLGIIPARNSSGGLNRNYLKDIQAALGITADEAMGLWSPRDKKQQFGPMYLGSSVGQAALDFALQRLKVLESRYTRPTFKKKEKKQMNKFEQLQAITKQLQELSRSLETSIPRTGMSDLKVRADMDKIYLTTDSSSISLNLGQAHKLVVALTNMFSSADMRDDA